jgi:tRNA (guanine-N7-)-methyltransferase
MSRRRKLEKFAELLNFDNVYELTENHNQVRINAYESIDIKGHWRQKAFGNDHPICLELACGRGEYTLALARRYPDINFIGIDIKGARIWQGAKIAIEEGLSNVAFLRIRIEQILHYFDEGEVDEIWITFPDPFEGKENRRMTSKNFLDKYVAIVKSFGKIHLKTDDPPLYDYSCESVLNHKYFDLVYQNDDIYRGPLFTQDLEFKTYYETQHLAANKNIKYLLFAKNV